MDFRIRKGDPVWKIICILDSYQEISLNIIEIFDWFLRKRFRNRIKIDFIG